MTTQSSEPNVGRRLRDLRQRRGLTQRALAQACDLSANAIGLIERGETSPSVSTLHRLALALEVPIAELFVEPGEQTVVLTKGSQRSRAQRIRSRWKIWLRDWLVSAWSPSWSPSNRAPVQGRTLSPISGRNLCSAWKAR